MEAKRSIHIIGAGTIGKPLIGLLLRVQQAWGVNEITFHKNHPRLADRDKVMHLIRRGAKLVVDAEKLSDFEKLSVQPTYDTREALAQAAVVIDCTPKGLGNAHKREVYQYLSTPSGFIAQGSEFGFGKMYAWGINDAALIPGEDRFIQVVSCNAHNLAVLIETLGLHDEAPNNLLAGHFVCSRQARDVSQEEDCMPAPQVSVQEAADCGTPPARDAWHLFQTLHRDLKLFASEITLKTPGRHSVWFKLRVKQATTLDEVLEKLRTNKHVTPTWTARMSTLCSCGRDHGYLGRWLTQTVVCVPTLAVRHAHEITGFCFTPQAGNALLSSLAATAWLLDPTTYEERLECIQPYLFDEGSVGEASVVELPCTVNEP